MEGVQRIEEIFRLDVRMELINDSPSIKIEKWQTL